MASEAALRGASNFLLDCSTASRANQYSSGPSASRRQPLSGSASTTAYAVLATVVTTAPAISAVPACSMPWMDVMDDSTAWRSWADTLSPNAVRMFTATFSAAFCGGAGTAA
jgi:hypothetical protein